jgi:hypothetical protein
MDKQDEKKRLEKEATAAIYINLAKEAIEVQRLDPSLKGLTPRPSVERTTPGSCSPT